MRKHLVRASFSLLSTAAISLCLLARPSAAQTTWPATAPAPICGNTQLLSGPATPPPGAIVIPEGSNTGMNWKQPGATFWFEPGVHTFGDEPYSQIVPGDNTTFIGAPGAVLDGNNRNLYAFGGLHVSNVTIRYLEIRNFGLGTSNNDQGTVNHDSGTGWTMEYNYVHDNDGAGVFIGSDNTVRYNCLKDNGQYGFSAFHEDGVSNVVLDHNEVVGNNRDNWEVVRPGCGCTGGGKFWATIGAVVTNNWVHDNFGPGLWADNNNAGFLFEGNLIENNDGVGLFYEVSYNFMVRNNAFKRNALVQGRARAERGDAFPSGAIYISESGGDARAGSTYVQSEITGNLFEDNWDGIVLWENADRFCRPGEPFDTTNGCPFFDHTWGTRYKTQNIDIHHNEFRLDKASIDCTNPRCGRMAVFSNFGTNPSNSPYLGTVIQNAITFEQNNRWSNNEYHGPWRFMPFDMGRNIAFPDWQVSPYQQDADSTFDGDTGQPLPPSDAAPNFLDADTAWLEGSIGKWQAVYGSTAAQSTEAAHGGRRSLRVDVTASQWAIETTNSPGFAATTGSKNISIWAKLGAGSPATASLSVDWLDANQTILKTDVITLSTLTTEWARTKMTVEAPRGTTTLLVRLIGTGGTGSVVYFDDIVVGDVENALDANTASLESTIGEWRPWYGSSVERAADQGYSGTHSLLIGVTSGGGWAVEIAAYPGFATTAGAKRISYWAKSGTGTATSVTLRVKWFNESGQVLQTELVALTGLSSQWQQAAADVVAPAGTTAVRVELYSGSGSAGSTLYVDNVVITPAP